MNQYLITGLFVAGFLLIIIINEIIYNRFNLKAEFSRKIAHISACLSSLVFIFTIESHWYVLFLGITFFLILYTGKKLNKFDSINSVKRKTAGSFLLPLSIYLMFLVSDVSNNKLYFVLPMLIVGISDPSAGIFGTVFKSKTSKIKIFNHKFNKTVLGSFVFFISALFISCLTLYFFNFEFTTNILLSLIIAFAGTIVEIISSKGIDNITVPAIIILILFLFYLL